MGWLAAAVAAAALLPAAASAAKSRTIVVTSVTVSMVKHDVGPTGASAGDFVTYRDRLLNAAPQFGRKKGAAVGADRGKLTFTGVHTATYEGTATLPGGTLRLSGAVYSTPGGGLIVPVVGGTGAFAGVRGTLTVGPGRDRVLNTYRLNLSTPIA
jgi:hypothetical protein